MKKRLLLLLLVFGSLAYAGVGYQASASYWDVVVQGNTTRDTVAGTRAFVFSEANEGNILTGYILITTDQLVGTPDTALDSAYITIGTDWNDDYRIDSIFYTKTMHVPGEIIFELTDSLIGDRIYVIVSVLGDTLLANVGDSVLHTVHIQFTAR